MNLILLLLVAASCAAREDLLNEQWSSLLLEIPLETLPISNACLTDMGKWMGGILAFSGAFQECYVQNKCSNQTKAIMQKNLYAIKQLDAFGRPPSAILDGSFTMAGSERECREVNDHYIYKTQYCYTFSQVGKTCNPAAAIQLKTGVCMPRSCSEKEITSLFSANQTLPIHACSAQCVPEHGETNAFTWVFTAFMGILISIVLSASIADFWRENVQGRNTKEIKDRRIQALLGFSFYTNASVILSTRPPREDHIKSLDCIRFFSMMWVVSGHVTLLWLVNDSLSPILTLTKPILSDTLVSAFYSVDTFFTLSGLVVSYMFFKMVHKNKRIVRQPATWIMFYVHRYLRLTPSYMLFICFYIAVVPLMIGTAYNDLNMASTVEVCQKYWWRNLIYINNFDTDNGCYGITWYLAVDTQIYLVAPIFLVALFLSHILGLVLIVVATAGSVAITFVVMYHYDMQASFIRSSSREASHLFFQKIYTMPWIRVTPYLVGIWTGYILAHVKKNRLPRISPIFPIIGWVVFLSIGLSCVYGPYQYLAFNEDWSMFARAFYYSFSRIGWALFVSWVVVANHYGWGGPIATFMEHPLWQPFGRLSYTAYLVHFFCVFYFVNLIDTPLHFTSIWEQTLGYTLPITAIAFIFAFFWSSFCEHPFLKLEKLLIDTLIGQRRPTPPAKEIKETEIEEITENGIQENWGDEEKNSHNKSTIKL